MNFPLILLSLSSIAFCLDSDKYIFEFLSKESK